MAKFERSKSRQKWLNAPFFRMVENPGRPKLSFSEAGPKCQKLKLKACSNLLDVSFSPSTIQGFRAKEHSDHSELNSAKKLDLNECINLKLKPDLSKKQYDEVRDVIGPNLLIFSSRHVSRLNKNFYDLLPIEISETKMYIPPSYLVEECFELIVENQNIKILTTDSVRFVLKWGGDGSNVPEVRFRNDPTDFSDMQIFMCSISPLFIFVNGVKFWSNSKPGSPYLCRPFLVEFCKENDQYTKNIIEYFGSKINFSADFISKHPNFKVDSFPTMHSVSFSGIINFQNLFFQ